MKDVDFWGLNLVLSRFASGVFASYEALARQRHGPLEKVTGTIATPLRETLQAAQ